MEEILGATPSVFFGLTIVIFGGVSFMMGQALANTWRPVWQIVLYGALLACVNRFLAWSLFDSDPISITGLALTLVVILAAALLAYYLTRAYKMVTQYPWLYERVGLFGWRQRQ